MAVYYAQRHKEFGGGGVGFFLQIFDRWSYGCSKSFTLSSNLSKTGDSQLKFSIYEKNCTTKRISDRLKFGLRRGWGGKRQGDCRSTPVATPLISSVLDSTDVLESDSGIDGCWRWRQPSWWLRRKSSANSQQSVDGKSGCKRVYIDRRGQLKFPGDHSTQTVMSGAAWPRDWPFLLVLKALGPLRHDTQRQSWVTYLHHHVVSTEQPPHLHNSETT